MIVAHAWVRKEKRARRTRELLRVTYSRQWSEQPASLQRVWSGRVVVGWLDSCAAFVYDGLDRRLIGSYASVEAAQEAVDLLLGTLTQVTAATAEANWKTWNRERRAAARAERERKLEESVARMTPEARERSAKLVAELDRAFPPRRRRQRRK